jgi:endonuclease G
LYGCPTGASPNDTIVVHHILALSNNPTTKFADWVAYQIRADTIGSGCSCTWKADPDLNPDVTLRPSDYEGLREALKSDRGHQAPLASLCGTKYWLEADYLSNITPQKSDLNQGAWEHLENGERTLIKSGVADAVYSITGPLYEREMPKLPHAHVDHTVPSGYWKVIAVRAGNSFEAIAFIMDQDTARDADYCGTNVSVGVVERRAHLELFSRLSTADRSALEQSRMGGDLLHAVGC